MNPSSDAKHRFNVIDALIILLLAVGAFFGVRAVMNVVNTDIDATVQVVMRMSGVAVKDVDALAVGDMLYDTSGNVVGRIGAVTNVPLTKSVFNYETDRYVEAPVEGRRTLYVEIDVPCVLSDGRYRTSSGTLVCAGEPLPLRLPFDPQMCTVVSVRPKEAEHEEA